MGTKLMSRSGSGSGPGGLRWALWGWWDPNLKARMHFVMGEKSLKTHQTWAWSTATALPLVGCRLIEVIWEAPADLAVSKRL